MLSEKEIKRYADEAAKIYEKQPTGQKDIRGAVRQVVPRNFPSEDFNEICKELGRRGGRKAAKRRKKPSQKESVLPFDE